MVLTREQAKNKRLLRRQKFELVFAKERKLARDAKAKKVRQTARKTMQEDRNRKTVHNVVNGIFKKIAAEEQDTLRARSAAARISQGAFAKAVQENKNQKTVHNAVDKIFKKIAGDEDNRQARSAASRITKGAISKAVQSNKNKRHVHAVVNGMFQKIIAADELNTRQARSAASRITKGAFSKAIQENKDRRGIESMVKSIMSKAVRENDRARFRQAMNMLAKYKPDHFAVRLPEHVPDLDDPAIQLFIKHLFTSSAAAFKTFPYSKKFDEEFQLAVTGDRSTCGAQRLGSHQAVAHTLASVLAKTRGNDRGFLVYHSTGSGKTLTCLALILAFWNTGLKIVMCTTPENSKNNSISTYAQNLMHFFPDTFPQYPSESVTSWQERVEGILKKRLGETWSFTRLASKLGLAGSVSTTDHSFLTGGSGSVVIMDEAHSIAAPKQPQYLGKYRALNDYLQGVSHPEVLSKVCTICLTATPGDSVPEVLSLLSLVRRKDQAPFAYSSFLKSDGHMDVPKLQRAFRGLITHVNLSGDRSRYAALKVVQHLVPMSMEHYSIYMERYLKMAPSKQLFQLEKRRQFYDTARKASNMVTASAAWKNAFRLASTKVQSNKLQALVSNVASLPGKHYCYSAFKTAGVTDIAKMLTEIGFKELKPSDVQGATGHDGDAKVFVPRPPSEYMDRAPRFINYDKAGFGERGNTKLRAFFDHDDNLRGTYCRLLLATGENFVGLNLLALQHVHLTEPLVTSMADQQAVGRGARNCSHSKLKPEERVVHIHRYFAAAPSPTVDKDIVKEINEGTDALDGYKELKTGITKLKSAYQKTLKAKKQPKKITNSGIVRGVTHNAVSRGAAKAELELAEEALQVLGEKAAALYGPQLRKKKLLRAKYLEQWATVPVRQRMIDEYIFVEALERDKDLLSVLNVLQSAAVDCRLFSSSHHKSKGINCM